MYHKREIVEKIGGFLVLKEPGTHVIVTAVAFDCCTMLLNENSIPVISIFHKNEKEINLLELLKETTRLKNKEECGSK